MIDVLVLCTGNICRSPMAAGLLAEKLDRLAVPARVHSAGLLDDGREASRHGVDLLAGRGIDLSGHRSRRLRREMVEGADLVLGMAREHVREAVVRAPSAFPRAFTLKELVRRGTVVGPRRAGEPLPAWLAAVHDGRATRDLIGASPDDDVADPIGGSPAEYARTARELDELLEALAGLAWGAATR